MKNKTLQDVFIDELKDLYNAESQLVHALPKMVKAVSSPDLRQAFEHHLEQTKNHVTRIEQITAQINASAKGKKCKGMEGVVAEGEEVMKEDYDESAMDAAIIAAAQRVEHYEMAGYGAARAHAQTLGYTQAVQLLQQTLDEEKEADRKLTEIAESQVNAYAK